MPDDRSDDPLARTATAPGAQKSAASGDAPTLEGTLGRYRLERELGAGGMGVVHAAFDPDLERRVALKVLRNTGGGDEARQRLLREARALARLTHPNVVTVHEVGSANGRDYVAMELIEGETLADWLKAETRSEEDIVGAFAAAGRGLAAAHAAGLVHRDFKPHNVLRRKDGRIVVTDFGLARGVEVAVELQATVKLTSEGKVHSDTPGSLSGLTETGSVLGTPAYMAPEQWTGEAVGPAADQFAFCVALWEALAGERPFRGATLEALRTEVTRGPSELDDSKLPRRLRAPLKRGLDPAPARRWPSMDALLVAIARGERQTRGVLMMIGSSAVVAAAIAYVAMDSDDKPAVAAPTCEAPALDPAVVWSPAIANEVKDKTSADVMRRFDALIGSWQSARSVACGLDTPMRARRLSCLDGVIVRLDAVRKARGRAKPTLDQVGNLLIDPGICNVDDPPRLPSALSEGAVLALALRMRPEGQEKLDDKAEQAAIAAAGNDKCALAFARIARAGDSESSKSRDLVEEALQLADTCGDDRTRADALVTLLAMQITVFLDPKLQKALAAAESAVRRVSQPDLVARLDLIKAEIAATSGQWDEQIKLADSAIRGFGQAHPAARLEAVQSKVRALMARHRTGDLTKAREEVAHWRPEAVRLGRPRVLTGLDTLDATAQWELGDLAGANARFPDLYERGERERKKPRTGGVTIEGTVVDPAGKPVANAHVVADETLTADSLSIGYMGPGSPRLATTDAEGRFKLEHVDDKALIIAQEGSRRSRVRLAKPNDKLVLEPTATVSGRVIDPDPQQLIAFAMLTPHGSVYQMVAPVKPDGTFTIERVPIGTLRIGAAMASGTMSQAVQLQEIVVGPRGKSGVEVRRAQPRKLHVVVRSAALVTLAGAEVFVVSGTVNIKLAKDVPSILNSPGLAIEVARPAHGETPPEAGKLASGDLLATFASAPLGTATACAIGLSGDFTDPAFLDKVRQHSDELEVRCVPVTPDAKAVTIEVPPMKRMD